MGRRSDCLAEKEEIIRGKQKEGEIIKRKEKTKRKGGVLKETRRKKEARVIT